MKTYYLKTLSRRRADSLVCRHGNDRCLVGLSLIRHLRLAIDLAISAGATPEFSVTGSARIDGCGDVCTIAFQADCSGVRLFGDVDSLTDVEAQQDFGPRSGNPGSIRRDSPSRSKATLSQLR